MTEINRSAFIWPLQIVDRETDEDDGTGDGDVAGETALVVSSDDVHALVETNSGSAKMVTVSGLFSF